MTEPNKAESWARAVQPVSATRATNAGDQLPAAAASQQTADVKYICPMPEHVSIEYINPGNCPICGMTLVPVTAAVLAKLQPGGKLLHYTCPMPEHSDVHATKPGKCPKCGMTMIPVMTAPTPSSNPLSQANLSANGPSLALYTCPRASHADVVSDKPGALPQMRNGACANEQSCAREDRRRKLAQTARWGDSSR